MTLDLEIADDHLRWTRGPSAGAAPHAREQFGYLREFVSRLRLRRLGALLPKGMTVGVVSETPPSAWSWFKCNLCGHRGARVDADRAALALSDHFALRHAPPEE